MHNLDTYKTQREKARWKLHKDATFCFEQILEVTIPQNSCTATYYLSHKPSQLYKQYMPGTFGEVKTN